MSRRARRELAALRERLAPQHTTIEHALDALDYEERAAATGDPAVIAAADAHAAAVFDRLDPEVTAALIEACDEYDQLGNPLPPLDAGPDAEDPGDGSASPYQVWDGARP